MATPHEAWDGDLVAELLDEVSALSEPERTTWFERRCGHDPALRREIEDLLRFLPDPETPERPSPGGDDDERRLGSTIGGFRLVRPLGRGGMGVVYEAEQLEPRRAVALKLLRGDALGPDARRRMRLEAQALARIDHPAVARVIASGVHVDPERERPPTPYLALELVPDARPISAWWHDQDRPLRERLLRFAEVCEGVHQAHLRGILHRDLKPTNVLVGSDGVPKVIDFGVAALADPDGEHASIAETRHALVGTLAHMSPEQAGGGVVDHKSDVYALGVMLYALLTGEMPYAVERGDLPGTIRRIAETIPPPPSRRNPRCRGDLDVIVATALAKAPSERYGSAAALAEDLRRTVDDQPILARPTPTVRRIAKALRRNLAVSLAIAAAILALVTALVASLLAGARTNRALFAATFANLERMAEAGETRAAAKSLETLAAFGLGEPWAARVHRSEIDETTGYLSTFEGRAAMTVAISPDGKLVAFSGEFPVILLVDADSFEIIDAVPLGDGEQCYCIAFVDDGRALRVSRESGTVEDWPVSDLRDGPRRTVLDFRGDRRAGSEDFLVETAFSADGRFACGSFWGNRDRHVLVDRATGRRETFDDLNAADMDYRFLVRAHPVRPLFALGGDRGVMLVDCSGPSPRRWPTPISNWTSDLAFSPDGRRLAAFSGQQLHVAEVPEVDPEAERPPLEVRTVESSLGSPWSVTWLPDSRRVVVGGRTPGILIVDTDTMRVVDRRAASQGFGWRSAVHPDGERIFLAGSIALRFTLAEPFPRLLRGPIGTAVSAQPRLHWIDGGAYLLASGPRGELDLLDPATGLARRLVDGTGRAHGTSAIDAAGRRLLLGAQGRPTLVLDRDGSPPRELPEIGRPPLSVSPSGRLGLVLDNEARLLVCDLETGTVIDRVEIPAKRHPRLMLWLDDERCYLGGVGNRMLLRKDGDAGWGLELGPYRIDGTPPGLVSLVALPPHRDGARWAFATISARLLATSVGDAWDIRTGEDLVIAELSETPSTLAASPDGRLVAAGGTDPRIVVYDRDRRLVLGGFPAGGPVSDLEFSPDGLSLASVDRRGQVQLFDTRTVAERERLRREKLEAATTESKSPPFSPRNPLGF